MIVDHQAFGFLVQFQIMLNFEVTRCILILLSVRHIITESGVGGRVEIVDVGRY